LLLVAIAGLLPGARLALGGEPKQADDKKPVLDIKDELKDSDPKDKKRSESFAKMHELKMAAGKGYKIDLRSEEFDSYLRLEDADGKELAFDDDSGGFPHARIVYAPGKDGTYKVIATTFKGGATGKYTLTVVEASKSEIVLAKAQRLFALKPEEQKEVIGEVRKIIAGKGKDTNQGDAMLALNIVSSVENNGDKNLAADLYTEFGKTLALSSDAKVADFGSMFQGAARRLKLVGNPMELKGRWPTARSSTGLTTRARSSWTITGRPGAGRASPNCPTSRRPMSSTTSAASRSSASASTTTSMPWSSSSKGKRCPRPTSMKRIPPAGASRWHATTA